jgi:phosphoribosylanthranilate isomerase
MAKVKICGITNIDDAVWAANLGAEFIGLNFYSESPRKVSAKKAKEIAAKLPPFVTPVGIFVNEPLESIKRLIRYVPLKVVQLHGQETPDICREVKALGAAVIKVFRLTEPLNPDYLTPYHDVVDYYLFDSALETAPGGTGESFDWAWLQAAAGIDKPWFLAGGLNTGNIAKAIKELHPPMVDVCSGVERLPRRKDFEAMKTFIQAAKAAR